MHETVRALTGLSALDEQLSGKEPLMADLALALEERRASLRETIPGVLLAAYDALGRTGRRPIVVAARGGHCSGCYLRLPPQLDSTIRRRLSMPPCPHCGRLLYPHGRMSDGDGASEGNHETGTGLARNESPSRPTRGGPRKSRPRREARASRRGSNPS
jgi:hypothetical protein